MKFCSKCKLNKFPYEFGRDKYRSDGLTTHCRNCRNLQGKQWRKSNPEKVQEINNKNIEKRKVYYNKPENKNKFKNRALLRSFGISLEDYNEMLDNQNGVCKICGQKERSKRNQSLCIDHNHKTGKIRGLLCTPCNRGIGLLKEDVQVMKKAIEYILGE